MAWFDQDDPDQAKPTIRERVRSIYERRFRRPGSGGRELIINSDGNPRIVTGGGEFLGYRCRDGSVYRPPEQPVEEWLRSDWGSDDEDPDWITRVPIRWRR